MNLSDSHLKMAFNRTPEDPFDASFCSYSDTVDFSTYAFPRYSDPNQAHHLREKHMREGGLVKRIRFTPL